MARMNAAIADMNTVSARFSGSPLQAAQRVALGSSNASAIRQENEVGLS